MLRTKLRSIHSTKCWVISPVCLLLLLCMCLWYLKASLQLLMELWLTLNLGWGWGGYTDMCVLCFRQCQRRKPSVLSYSCPSVNLELGLQPVSPGDTPASTSHSTKGYGRFQGRRCQSGPMSAQQALWLTKRSSQPRPWPSHLCFPRAATSTSHYVQFNYSFRVHRANYPILLGLASC